MTKTTSIRRIVIAFVACMIVLPSVAHGDPDPVNELEALLFSATNVTATGISPTTIFVAWTDNSLIETGYRIEISTQQNGVYDTAGYTKSCDISTQNGTKPVCFAQVSTGPASDPLPRWIRVVPILELGTPEVPGVIPASPPGQGVQVIEGLPSPPDPAILAPAPPTNLRCVGGCRDVTQIDLAWQDHSDEAYFWLMRAPNSPQDRCSAKPFGGVPFAELAANTTTFHQNFGDADLGKTYFYKVVAVRDVNIVKMVDDSPTIVHEKSYSDGINPECLRVIVAPVPAPADPTGLTATFTPPTVQLSWTDAQGASDYEEDGWFVEYGPTSSVDDANVLVDGKLTTRKRLDGAGAVTFTDIVPADSLDRCYRVRGYRGGPAYSHYSNLVCIGTSVPKAPTGLTAVAVSNSQVNLAWTDRSSTEQNFVIQRCEGVCTASGTWTQIATTPPDVTTFSDQGTTERTTYSYRVFAKNAKGLSASSNIAVAITPAALIGPPVLTATPAGSHSVQLSWTSVTGATGYRIEYRNGTSGAFATLRDFSASTTSYLDQESLSAGETRCYRARSIKGASVSDPSTPPVCPTTNAADPPNGDPTAAAGVAISNTVIDLTWTDNASNEDSFAIDILETLDVPCESGNPAQLDAKLAANDDTLDNKFFTLHRKAPKYTGSTPGQTTFRIDKLVPHSSYFFRVRAVNQDGISDRSNTTRCVTTRGPALPVWNDPAADSDTKATRCDFTLDMPVGTDPYAVERVQVYVNAYVDGVASSTDSLTAVYPVPGGTTAYSVTTDGNGTHWKLNYQFRKGPVYRLMATAYGANAPNRYASAVSARLDVKVLADCPVNNPDPLP